ncbi:MAG: hypothetical protein KJO62_03185 [Gammaproteobacteria bacterium]|nr:hypothetical protein [Gammaproteobacteria bacterium]NND38477.1 hypothetical protein [Pseudomonadales bacterium]NNM11565.1 hypothetical protein [Pseudomonadales bacterium]RZV60198.1 MAG: hypothetical protein EX270_00265 [Pseudomonadales bacterium]
MKAKPPDKEALVLEALRHELTAPKTTLGKRYAALLIVTIVASIFYLFIVDEYPASFPLGSTQLLVVEWIILAVFSVDFFLRLGVTRLSDWRAVALLACDGLAIIPSLWVVLNHFGFIDLANLEILALLRLFRLMRVVKLLRMSNVLTDVFGASVLTLVFGTMAVHLGLRVLVQEVSSLSGFDVLSLFDKDTLMIAVTAVGSIFGIGLAITFGIVKRKQIEISELHRTALDSLQSFERDINQHGVGSDQGDSIDFDGWRRSLQAFLFEAYPYEPMKRKTNELLASIRAATKNRPSLDVPFHNGLVQNMSAFLSKTQIEFHPAFYLWLNRIAHIYFLLMMIAAPGLTGVVAQLLVIYVFKGLVVVIDDMDHAVDLEVTLFNSKILRV